MLKLCRRIGERIIIDYPNGAIVEIEVLAVNGKQVKIGLDAPGDVQIIREELKVSYEQKT